MADVLSLSIYVFYVGCIQRCRSRNSSLFLSSFCVWSLFCHNWAYVLSFTKIWTNITGTCVASNFVFNPRFIDREFYKEYVNANEGSMKVVSVYRSYNKWRRIL